MSPKNLIFSLLLIFAGPVWCQTPNWTSLFNGNDLSGWHVLGGTAKYEIKNSAIVGTTVPNTPNTFLATDKEYGDFILELEVMVHPEMNSGIQIRSLSKPDYQKGRVHGYQVEIDPSARAWSGGIYDEGRRGWLYNLEVNPTAHSAFRNDTWNHYRIEAIGNSIRTWINGIPCTDLVDDMTAKGFIALQVHSINETEEPGRTVQWRNVRIQTENLVQSPWTDIFVVTLIPNYLSPQERAQGWELLFDGKTTDGWRGAHKDKFPEGGWKIENGELRVVASDGAESKNGGDIVTNQTYSAFEFQLDFKLTPGANSGVKYFVTEGYAASGSAIGLEFQLLDDALHPDAKLGAAGNRTIGSLYDLIPAASGKTVNPIGEWNHARVVVAGNRTDRVTSGNQASETTLVGASVTHWLNNRPVVAYERADQTFDALVARSKYAEWKEFGHWTEGHILLQDHGNEVHFRSIKVRRLPTE